MHERSFSSFAASFRELLDRLEDTFARLLLMVPKSYRGATIEIKNVPDFFPANNTLSAAMGLMRPISEYIPISEAGFSRVLSNESAYRFAAALMNCECSSSRCAISRDSKSRCAWLRWVKKVVKTKRVHPLPSPR